MIVLTVILLRITRTRGVGVGVGVGDKLPTLTNAASEQQVDWAPTAL